MGVLTQMLQYAQKEKKKKIKIHGHMQDFILGEGGP